MDNNKFIYRINSGTQRLALGGTNRGAHAHFHAG